MTDTQAKLEVFVSALICAVIVALFFVWPLALGVRDLVPLRGVPRESTLARALSVVPDERRPIVVGGKVWHSIAWAAGGLAFLVGLNEDLPAAGQKVVIIVWTVGLLGLAVQAGRAWTREMRGLALTYSQGTYYKHLGLRQALRVGPRPRTDEVFTGQRRGRDVRIDLFVLDQRTRVWVQPRVQVTSFEVIGARRMNPPVPATDPAFAAFAALPESSAWEGAIIRAGEEGIEILRAHRLRGQRGWLYDLWLAERIAHAYDEAGAALDVA